MNTIPAYTSIRRAILLAAILTALTAGGARADDLIVYDDALAADWSNWSWSTTLDFAASYPVHDGAASMSAAYNSGWAGVYLHSSTTIESWQYAGLSFWIHGGAEGGQTVNICLYDGGGEQAGSGVTVTPTAGTWGQYTVTMEQLGSPGEISAIVLQEYSGTSATAFYIDELTLTDSGLTEEPEVDPETAPALTVDAAAGLHTISPYIYGMSFTDEDLAKDLRLPVRRWGGNSTTRYNWQIDVSNRASDWYFENIPKDRTMDTSILPNGSETDLFHEQDLRTGTETILTMPLIGWTPKSRNIVGGFSVAKYGAQQSVDPWATDCGNGVLSDGTVITWNDPADTSYSIDSTFVSDWIAHLIGNYGAANAGGVRFYALDNEPMLWNSTHRDVFPDPLTYDEIASRTLAIAPAIKAADPAAMTMGPVVWGWVAYFYSAYDSGLSAWSNPPDCNAHGGTPFVEWYLQQMAAYEASNGQRILDYLDIHYYEPASGVALSTAGEASTQKLRLRSTRSLWDETYTNEGWIADEVGLIPRMHNWVDENYPGTKLALTEYNWGGHEHINGALAQADVLGIFGREGLDLACLWGPPDSGDPCAYAFRMYLNYDGGGSCFGETGVSAVSGDEEAVSIFAALRGSDGALTVMIVNKSGAPQEGTVAVENFAALPSVELYRYSDENLAAIENIGPATFGAEGLTMTFPADSITMAVLSPASSAAREWVAYR